MGDPDDKQFEESVKHIARLLWSIDGSGGAIILDGLERDSVFVTEETVHLLECTTSRSKDNARVNARKISEGLRKLRSRFEQHSQKGWYVTQGDPTPDQRAEIDKYGGLIVAISYAQFLSKLVKGDDYVRLRQQYVFGSARDPIDNSFKDRTRFIRPSIEVLGAHHQDLWGFDTLVKSFVGGQRFALLGDYGAGKSTILRELFFKCCGAYDKGHTPSFPILLNLRDHHGQNNAAEALERHGRLIGFPNPHQLVRAWRAGIASIMLDGFDELGTAAWSADPQRLQEIRKESCRLVREFVRDTPPNVPIIISGREHYFSSDNELRSALGVSVSFLTLRVVEFTNDQAKQFLKDIAPLEHLPAWLPSKPLLLAYLAHMGVLQDATNLQELSPAAGWSYLLKRIADREAEIEGRVDGNSILALLSALATMARRTFDGLGPLSTDSIDEAFKDVLQFAPDEYSIVVVQRLPGLGRSSNDDGDRYFVDEALVDTARAHDVLKFIDDPHTLAASRRFTDEWLCCLGEVGLEVIAAGITDNHVTEKRVYAACHVAREQLHNDVLVFDLVRAALRAFGGYTSSPIFITNVIAPFIAIGPETGTWGEIQFNGCIFHEVEVQPGANSNNSPVFDRCLVDELDGPAGEADLPRAVFNNCEIRSFATSAATNADIRELALSREERVALTVLRKVYLQRGRGRLDSALQHGLHPEDRGLVPAVVELLKRKGFLHNANSGGRRVWLPVRDMKPRVQKIVSAPTRREDELYLDLGRLVG